MQAREELGADARYAAEVMWLDAQDDAVQTARRLHEQGAHIQIVNRVIEPLLHSNTLVTATDYANFYALRRHQDAQPEIKALLPRPRGRNDQGRL
jgi:hypothetical protein